MRKALIVAVMALVFGTGAPSGADAGLTIDPVGFFDKATGHAIVSGTYTCPASSSFGYVYISASQRVGRVATITNTAMMSPQCANGPVVEWSVEVAPTSGMYKGGIALVTQKVIFIVSSGMTTAEITQEVKLRLYAG